MCHKTKLLGFEGEAENQPHKCSVEKGALKAARGFAQSVSQAALWLYQPADKINCFA